MLIKARLTFVAAVILVACAIHAGCNVSSTKVTIFNLPGCVGAIQVNFSQTRGDLTVKFQDGEPVKNQQAVFENLGKKLEDANFDLSEDIEVTVSLLATGPECRNIPPRSGKIRVSKDGDSQLNYKDLH